MLHLVSEKEPQLPCFKVVVTLLLRPFFAVLLFSFDRLVLFLRNKPEKSEDAILGEENWDMGLCLLPKHLFYKLILKYSRFLSMPIFSM